MAGCRWLIRQLVQELHHSHVIGIRRIILLSNLEILLRRLENERNIPRASIAQQPSKWLDANLSISYEHVPILVGAERTFAIVEMEEARCFASRLLELIEHDAHRVLRHRDVVTTRVQVARIQSVARAIAQ